MRIATIAAVSGLAAGAHAQMPVYDAEVYYNFIPTSRNLDGVIAGASRPVFWGDQIATVIDSDGVEHVLDVESIVYSSMQHVDAHGVAFGTGWSATVDKMLIYDGTLSLHDFPGEIHSDIIDGNAAGEVIIWSRNPDVPSNASHAYVWDGSGWQNIGSLRADPNDWAAVNPNDINAHGCIVGRSTTDFTNAQGGLYGHAFLYVPGEGMQDLGTLKGPEGNSRANHISLQGDIVGASQDAESLASQATLWRAGEIMRLSPEGTYQSEAELITEDGTVFGWVEVIEGPEFTRHAFRWTEEDGFEDLGTTEDIFLGFESANAQGIAVGSDMTSVYEQHAVAYYPGVGLVPLTPAVENVKDITRLMAGVSIHDDGSILATGLHIDEDNFMTDRSVTFTPVCSADMNGDGALDVLDFVAFQAAFVKGTPDADCDGDGLLTILDFVCFQASFSAGCV